MKRIIWALIMTCSCAADPVLAPKHNGGCCAALPDEGAVVECVQLDQAECVVGVGCEMPDGGVRDIPGNCGMDAGVGDASEKQP